MYQLTYILKDTDPFLHQISQFGARYVSKGPEAETYFHSPTHQLRLDEGVTVNLVLLKKHDHYQKLFEVDIPQHKQMKHLLGEVLGEQIHLSKKVIRYYLKNILIEIHQFNKLPQLMYLQGQELNDCKDLARKLSLEDKDRISKTSADLALE